MLNCGVLHPRPSYNGQMTRRLLANPYAQYTTAIDLPGLKAGSGEEFHYPWIAPEGHIQHRKEIPVTAVAGKLAPGWSILPGWKIGTEGKGQGMRQQVFKLLYDGKLTDKYALSPEGAAELSHKIDPATGKRWVPEWRKAKANPAYFMTGDEEDEGKVVRTPRQPRKKGGQAGGSVRLTPVQMQKAAELMREGLSRAEAVAFVLHVKANPQSVLSRARSLNAQYDRDHYTGSSRAQLAQARFLGAEYDRDHYTGSSPEQLEYARMLEEDYDLSRDNPRKADEKYSKMSFADLQEAAALGDRRAQRLIVEREAVVAERLKEPTPAWREKDRTPAQKLSDARLHAKLKSQQPFLQAERGRSSVAQQLAEGKELFGGKARPFTSEEMQKVKDLVADGYTRSEAWALVRPKKLKQEDNQGELSVDYLMGEDNPRVFHKGKGKYKQTPQSVEQQFEHFLDVGQMWHEAGPEDYHAGSGAFAARFPAPSKKYKAQDNPFWVTEAGSAIHHSDEAWAGYQSRHADARLPAQAVREALLEKQGDFAPGWSGRQGTKVAGNGKPYAVVELYYKGENTGAYATDRRKAVEMSHAYSPKTGKSKRN